MWTAINHSISETTDRLYQKLYALVFLFLKLEATIDKAFSYLLQILCEKSSDFSSLNYGYCHSMRGLE